MNRRGLPRHAAELLFAALAALSGPRPALGACDPPQYRVARTLSNTQSQVYLAISIQLQDFAPQRLVCLAATLKKAYPGRDVVVSIYSSPEAAERGEPDIPDRPQFLSDYEYKLHSFYSYDRKTHKEYLLIAPDGYKHNDPLLTTRIDLPAVGLPVCKIEFNGRCLLEFEQMDYPGHLYHGPPASGQVTVRGNIQRDGAVSGVAAVSAKAPSVKLRSLLVRLAVKNLRSWRFEPGKRMDSVHIKYDFDTHRDPTTLRHGTQVRFHLPSEVSITWY